mgnify:CR=1 FL=1
MHSKLSDYDSVRQLPTYVIAHASLFAIFSSP